MRKITSQILKINTSDPNDTRRGELLNILLIGVAGLTILMLVATALIKIIIPESELSGELYLGGILLLSGIIILFAINRYRSVQTASTLFHSALYHRLSS